MRRQAQLRIVGSGETAKLRVVGDWDGAPLEGLCASAGLARSLDKLQRHLVEQARSAGFTWTEIGGSLGISKQSAWERFSVVPDD